MKAIYAAAAVLGLVAVPAIAWAEEGHGGDHHGGHGRHGRMLEKVDTNKDGNLSLDEVQAAAAERFKRLDKNADGVVTAEEAPRMFDTPDADHNGQVTADELATHAAARLKRADANGDGMVSEAEREAMRAKWKERRGKEEAPPPE